MNAPGQPAAPAQTSSSDFSTSSSPLHPPSVMHNVTILSSTATLAACFSGLVAGILGLTNQYGFLLYILTSSLSALTVALLKCEGNIGKYVPQAHSGAQPAPGGTVAGGGKVSTMKGWWALMGLGQENLLGFLLFWIGSYALIHDMQDIPVWPADPNPMWWTVQPTVADTNHYIVPINLDPSLSDPTTFVSASALMTAPVPTLQCADPVAASSRSRTTLWRAFLPEHAHHLENPPPAAQTHLSPSVTSNGSSSRPGIQSRRDVNLVVDTSRAESDARENPPQTAGAALAEEYLNFPQTASTVCDDYTSGTVLEQRSEAVATVGHEVHEIKDSEQNDKEGDSMSVILQLPRHIDMRQEVIGSTQELLQRLRAMTTAPSVRSVLALSDDIERALHRFELDSSAPYPHGVMAQDAIQSVDTAGSPAQPCPEHSPLLITGVTPSQSSPAQPPSEPTKAAEEELLPHARHLYGQWLPIELVKLQETIEKAKARSPVVHSQAKETKKGSRVARKVEEQVGSDQEGSVDWLWVCEELIKMGSSRSRHQILCKAVELRLKEPLVRRSRNRKRQLESGNDDGS